MSARTKLYLFTLVWVVLNILQAIFLDLTPDEAYYVYYAKDLAWGYLDHPPMVAWLIAIGQQVLPGELGVRICFTILSAVSILILYRLIRPKDIRTFILTLPAVLAVQLSGFHALPDVPLIFFALLFYWLLQSYIEKKSVLSVVLLPIVIAGIILSKYYGLLIPFFTVIAMPSLLKRWSFWLIAIVSFLLLGPHIAWQYAFDFPTVQFHLFERNWASSGFDIASPLLFLPFQFIIAGPLIGIMLLWSALKAPKNQGIYRILQFNLWGTYAVFFLLTLTGSQVHIHWTTVAIVPLLILAITQLDIAPSNYKLWFTRLAVASWVVFALGRSVLFYDYIPQSIIPHESIDGIEDWAQTMSEASEGHPVVFMNDYGEAARYEFYTQSPAVSIGNMMSRRTQYDLKPLSQEYFGQRVCVFPNWETHIMDSVFTPLGDKRNFIFVDTFVSYPDVRVTIEEVNDDVSAGNIITLNFHIDFKNYSEEDLLRNPNLAPRIGYFLFRNGKRIDQKVMTEQLIEYYDTQRGEIEVSLPDEPGNYVVKLGVACGWLPATHNSNIVHLKVR